MQILEFNQIIMMMFLAVAVWQDLKTRTISVWVYVIFGSLAGITEIWQGIAGEIYWIEKAESMGIGVVLLIISRLTRGAVGEGDGYFFIVTGIVFGVWDNLALLLFGLLLCSCYSLGVVIWGAVMNVQVRTRTVPFLPFLLPVGMWMILG